MKLSIYDALWAEPETGADLANEREFRRSTRSILKGVVLIKQMLERNPDLKTLIENKRLAFVVSSSVGEIEITRDFLKDFAISDTARPFLFQLSSHNSTAGFLAQYFGLKGATVTLSNAYQSAEVALESAHLFLNSDACDAALVFCVDQSIEEWVDLEMYRKNPQLKASSGASLLLLGKDDLKAHGPFKAKAYLSDLNYSQSTKARIPAGAFYDSDLAEHVARLVEAKKSGRFEFVRPDSTLTSFELHV